MSTEKGLAQTLQGTGWVVCNHYVGVTPNYPPADVAPRAAPPYSLGGVRGVAFQTQADLDAFVHLGVVRGVAFQTQADLDAFVHDEQ